MHLNRGHTNSSVISTLPFTKSASFEKPCTPFLHHSGLIIHFLRENARLMKYKMSFWLATACAPSLSGSISYTWGKKKAVC